MSSYASKWGSSLSWAGPSRAIPAAPADAPLRGLYLGGDEAPAVLSIREPNWYGDSLSSDDLGQ